MRKGALSFAAKRLTLSAIASAALISAAAHGLGEVKVDRGVVIRTKRIDTVAKDRVVSPIRLKHQKINPAIEPTIDIQQRPGWSVAAADLFIVQFRDGLTTEDRNSLRDLGAELHQYLPERSYVVRMTPHVAASVSSLSNVAWVGEFSAKLKAQPRMVQNFAAVSRKPARFDLVLVDKADRARLMRKVELLGGKVANPNAGSILIEAELDAEQLGSVLELPEVLWAERTPEIELDVDKARVQGGANYLENQLAPPGYTGVGVNGHVMEGINPTHQGFRESQFRKAPISVVDGAYDDHGQATYGIIFGDGTGRPEARGLAPNAQGFYTNYNAVYAAPEGSEAEGSRYHLMGVLKNEHRVMFQTASWGFSRVTEYTARSAEMDNLIFDHDITITQSQSNAGTRDSRPQAWAKNIISVGGVMHYDNADPSDDRWNGRASIGPATDGRIKPDLTAYYDRILTTSHSGYDEDFGGTSGATPIVAGHLALTLEMWTDGIFGNELPRVDGDRYDNRPHFTTAKALMINTAQQYAFEGEAHDLTRVHQGWGFPSLSNMFNGRNQIFVVNEDVVLEQGEAAEFTVTVADGTSLTAPKQPELKVTLVFADPEGNVAADVDRINNLDLKVTAPDGTIYWGNVGLLAGNYSKAGGTANTVDTVENVFIRNPAAGEWKIEVLATELNADGHVETSTVDADFALVVSGIQRQ